MGTRGHSSGLSGQLLQARPDRKIRFRIFVLILFQTHKKELNLGKMVRCLRKI
jgi:hypothetical protein